MNIEEMMQSLEIDGKTYIEKYTETLEKIEKQKVERKRQTDLENLSAVHCFPEISKVIAEHQLVKWRHPADLADAFRYIFLDNIGSRIGYRYHWWKVELLPDLQILIPRPEGMRGRRHSKLCLSVGSVLRRRMSIHGVLDYLHKYPEKLADMDTKTALQVERAYRVIYDEGV